MFKRLIVLVLGLAIFASGCATMVELSEEEAAHYKEINAQYERERIAAQQRAYEEEKAREKIEAAKEAIQPGDTTEKVIAAWGKPDLKEIVKGVLYFRYLNSGKPMIFAFKKNRVTDYFYDAETAANLRNQANLNAQMEENRAAQHRQIQADRERNEAIIRQRTWETMINSFQPEPPRRSVSCTTFGNTTRCDEQ